MASKASAVKTTKKRFSSGTLDGEVAKGIKSMIAENKNPVMQKTIEAKEASIQLLKQEAAAICEKEAGLEKPIEVENADINLLKQEAVTLCEKFKEE
ncbi:hypothetical protein PMIN06_008483 [Paraphaeosphaeria minitans]|uniref:Uncharacterized protein n=1 Tax=Paraphaeosphaeria minitans TaxID=565426 RepID=A0A9P6KT88_9PLEO|nr:hypothetical protein PMIN01_03293 [Paraphaeosphaeria minitans]